MRLGAIRCKRKFFAEVGGVRRTGDVSRRVRHRQVGAKGGGKPTGSGAVCLTRRLTSPVRRYGHTGGFGGRSLSLSLSFSLSFSFGGCSFGCGGTGPGGCGWGGGFGSACGTSLGGLSLSFGL